MRKTGEFLVPIVAENVSKARIKLNMTKRAVALASNITPAYMTLIEQGKQPNVSNKIALALSTTLLVNVECICPSYKKEETRAALTAPSHLTTTEKNEYAEKYITHIRCFAWENRHYFGLDSGAFNEAFSVALVVFAEALNTFSKNGGANLRTYVECAIKNRFIGALRKATYAKRLGDRYSASLDAEIGGQTSEQRRQSLYSLYAVEDTELKRLEAREECGEAMRTVPRREWANKREAERLIAFIGVGA